MTDPSPPPEHLVRRLRAIAMALPEAHEQEAWRGTRWRIRQRTFAHVLTVLPDRPSAYAEATGDTASAVVLTFHAEGEDLLALTHSGPPFFKPPWSPTIVGMVVEHPERPGEEPDWSEVTELLTDSYRHCAPQKLLGRLDQADQRPAK